MIDVQAGFLRLRGHSKTDLLSLLKDSAKNDAMINSKDFARIMQGPSERDLVYSGLEETMSNAVREMVFVKAQKGGGAWGRLTNNRRGWTRVTAHHL